LAFQGADTVIVAGISTSGCVRATVVDAFSLNYRVIVPEECVADRVVVPHKVNLFDMQMKYASACTSDRTARRLLTHRGPRCSDQVSGWHCHSIDGAMGV